MGEEQDSWLSGLGVDVGATLQAISDTASSAVKAVEDVGAPVVAAGPSTSVQAAVPAPELVEVIEEAAVSGVRAVVSAAPEIAEGVAVGAGAAAATIVGGVVVGFVAPFAIGWAIDHAEEVDQRPDPDEVSPPGGAPAQADSPDGGADDPTEASIREKRKNAQPLPPPTPGVDYDDESQPQTPSCKSMFPDIPQCGASGSRGFENLADAQRNEPDWDKVVRNNADTFEQYSKFPEGKNGHRTYYDKDDGKLFSLVYTPCCTDTAAGPVVTWRWVSAG